MTNAQKFWSKVDRSGPFPDKLPGLGRCWDWTGGKSDTGYGTFMDVETKKRHNAHRFSWILHNGSVPDGLCVLHKCDRRECVRPSHLFLGTRIDNSHDALAKGRLAPQAETFKRLWREKWAGKRCGSGIHCSKLKEDQVIKIRSLYNPSEGLTCNKLALSFGVSLSTIFEIVTRKTWKHVK